MADLLIVWRNMKARCLNPKNTFFGDYGGRGISIDERWISFENFFEDMAGGYSEGLTLDRIDNDGNYSRENCRWSSPKDQANNRRNNVWIEWGGVKKTLSQWADSLGIKFSTLRQRYYVYQWDIDRCFTQPIEVHMRGQNG